MKAKVVERGEHLVAIMVANEAKELKVSAYVAPDFVDEFIRRVEQEPRIVYRTRAPGVCE